MEELCKTVDLNRHGRSRPAHPLTARSHTLVTMTKVLEIRPQVAISSYFASQSNKLEGLMREPHAAMGKTRVTQRVPLAELVRNGDKPIGSMVFSTDPAVTALLGSIGYTFVVIDQEHAPNDTQSTLNHIRAAEANGIIPLVRVSENRPKLISAALDMGAHGIIVPMIGSADEARAALRASQYTPGGRGMCTAVEGARWADFEDWAEHCEASNNNICLIPLIETRAGVENLGEIVAVDGIDLVFFGMADLAQDLGVDFHTEKAKIQEIWRAAVDTAHEAGGFLGAPAGRGFDEADFSTIRNDLTLLKIAATQQLAEVTAARHAGSRAERRGVTG